MPAYQFKSDGDRSGAVNALRVAAERFADHAETMTVAGMAPLAEQFRRQAADALRIADEIEDLEF